MLTPSCYNNKVFPSTDNLSFNFFIIVFVTLLNFLVFIVDLINVRGVIYYSIRF